MNGLYYLHFLSYAYYESFENGDIDFQSLFLIQTLGYS